MSCLVFRINSLRLMHVFPAGFGGGGCGDDLGLRYSNQVSVLCEGLLNAHFVDKPLWAAMVRLY